MPKRAQPSASCGGAGSGSGHQSERSATNSNHSHLQPRVRNRRPRGQEGGNARGRGRNYRRNSERQPGRVEATTIFSPRNYYSVGDMNRTHPQKTFPPDAHSTVHPPFPIPYGIPPWHQYLGPNIGYHEHLYNDQFKGVPLNNSKPAQVSEENCKSGASDFGRIKLDDKTSSKSQPGQIQAEYIQDVVETRSSFEKFGINVNSSVKSSMQVSRKDETSEDEKNVSNLKDGSSSIKGSYDKRSVFKDDELRPPVGVDKTLVLINQSAAKDAVVPMNFGIELLDSVTHNNIELVANQGAKIRANSAILSLNSPVIHHMTTTLELLTIDMEEFSEQSVRYFVEAAYTGKFPTIPREVFRDLNKVAHAFKVSWLQISCFKMFSEFTNGIPDILPPYEELLFVFEEAAYVLSKLKKRDFLEVALGKITTSHSKSFFITKYLKDIGTLSDYHLDMVIEIAGAEVDRIVQPLKEHLLSKQLGILRDQFVEQKEVEETAISEECKYLLENCDLSSCRRYSPDLFEELFDILEKLAESKEEMKWVLQLHRKPTNIPDVPTSSNQFQPVQ